ncbi:hypothetical protein EDC04DRAFT_668117 [Pisolithus marmoratus]|nr:hypothetical protein EDC04DRAFT_668117 [Pisolithus marmoratus]
MSSTPPPGRAPPESPHTTHSTRDTRASAPSSQHLTHHSTQTQQVPRHIRGDSSSILQSSSTGPITATTDPIHASISIAGQGTSLLSDEDVSDSTKRLPKRPRTGLKRSAADMDASERASSSSESSHSHSGMVGNEIEPERSQQSQISPAVHAEPPPKKKRTRTLTTPHQSAALHELLAKSRFPTTAMREEVGRRIGLSARKVQFSPFLPPFPRGIDMVPKSEAKVPTTTRQQQYDWRGLHTSFATCSGGFGLVLRIITKHGYPSSFNVLLTYSQARQQRCITLSPVAAATTTIVIHGCFTHQWSQCIERHARSGVARWLSVVSAPPPYIRPRMGGSALSFFESSGYAHRSAPPAISRFTPVSLVAALPRVGGARWDARHDASCSCHHCHSTCN